MKLARLEPIGKMVWQDLFSVRLHRPSWAYSYYIHRVSGLRLGEIAFRIRKLELLDFSELGLRVLRGLVGSLGFCSRLSRKSTACSKPKSLCSRCRKVRNLLSERPKCKPWATSALSIPFLGILCKTVNPTPQPLPRGRGGIAGPLLRSLSLLRVSGSTPAVTTGHRVARVATLLQAPIKVRITPQLFESSTP